ncbi:MAG: hypothetical protein MI924_11625 [Chloroflexales bacterium]|nr:hypothetical protein [Chloroflexales bacterium]
MGRLGPHGIHEALMFLAEALAVAQEECGQGLVLGRSGDLFMDCQVGEEGFNFGRIHRAGMARVMKEDQALNPVGICFFSTDGIVLNPQDLANLIAEFGRVGWHGWSSVLW